MTSDMRDLEDIASDLTPIEFEGKFFNLRVGCNFFGVVIGEDLDIVAELSFSTGGNFLGHNVDNLELFEQELLQDLQDLMHKARDTIDTSRFYSATQELRDKINYLDGLRCTAIMPNASIGPPRTAMDLVAWKRNDD